MNIRQSVQLILDNTLLKYGILSSHIRRVISDKIPGTQIKVNNDAYVVYRIATTNKKLFGDGRNLSTQTVLDINYYYNYDKNASTVDEAIEIIEEISNAFSSLDTWKVISGPNDIYDIDNNFRGFNIEVRYTRMN